MPSSSKYLQLLRQAQTIQPNSFPANFPYEEFQFNLSKYNEQDSWYNGVELEEEMEVAGKKIEKYPVKINPIKGTCARHVGMLFGDIRHDDRLLVTPRVVKNSKMTQEEKNDRDNFEEILNQIWYESNGRDLQLNNGRMSQRYGGCVFYAKYDPFSKKTYPVTIEAPSVKFFVGVPNSANPFDLEEGWIVRPISGIELQNQGIVSVDKNLFGGNYEFADDLYWISEHYTKKIFEVFVNEKRAGRSTTLPSGKNSTVPFGTDGNKIETVPIVYIPHIRDTSNFYGDNVFDGVTGIVREINARVADYGDAVSMDSHDIIATRNVNGQIQVSQLLPGVTRVDLGSSVNVTGQEAQPEAVSLRKSALASNPMKELVNDILYKQYRRDAIHPAVCDGEDEGSQRSSQTLTTRMWALETHVNEERVSWVSGLNVLNKIITKMLVTYAPEIKLAKDVMQYRTRHVWYPTLKKDTNDLVTEVTTRHGGGLSSMDTAIEAFGDIEDVEVEVKKIMEEKKEIAEMNSMMNKPFGGGGSTPPTKTTPKKKSDKGD